MAGEKTNQGCNDVAAVVTSFLLLFFFFFFHFRRTIYPLAGSQ